MRKNFWPIICTAIVFLLLVFLGVWQVKRLYQKQQMIINASKHVELPVLQMSCKSLINNFSPDILYRKIIIRGRFLPTKNIFIYAGPIAIRGKPGNFILSEFECLDKTHFIVNQGWVELSSTNRYKFNNNDLVEFAVTIMPAEKPGIFTPTNDLINGIWYYIDFDDIANNWKISKPRFYLMKNFIKNIYPIGKDPVIKIRNDHLSYAITWFSLALILLIMFYFRFIKVKKF